MTKHGEVFSVCKDTGESPFELWKLNWPQDQGQRRISADPLRELDDLSPANPKEQPFYYLNHPPTEADEGEIPNAKVARTLRKEKACSFLLGEYILTTIP